MALHGHIRIQRTTSAIEWEQPQAQPFLPRPIIASRGIFFFPLSTYVNLAGGIRPDNQEVRRDKRGLMPWHLEPVFDDGPAVDIRLLSVAADVERAADFSALFPLRPAPYKKERFAPALRDMVPHIPFKTSHRVKRRPIVLDSKAFCKRFASPMIDSTAKETSLRRRRKGSAL